MELVVLGRTADDKGTQLERLTRDLLERLGYVDIVLNEIGPGGQEIDLSAYFVFPTVSGEQRRQVICECKAHKTRTVLPDWLKFIGKIHLEEIRMGQEVSGCFIAMSGVNGSVSGSFREFCQYRQNIELITGDQLIVRLGKQLGFEPVNTVVERLSTYTARQFVKISIVYYDKLFCWPAEFRDGSYCLLNLQGRPLEQTDAKIIEELLAAADWPGEHVDLQAEKETMRRAAAAESILISELMLNEGRISLDQFPKPWSGPQTDEFLHSIGLPELEAALSRLLDRGLLFQSESQNKWLLFPDGAEFRSDLTAALLTHLLSNIIPIGVLGCPYYDACITADLLKEIQKIQGGLKIPQTEEEVCINYLRYSPSALSWALHPDPTIANLKDLQNVQRIQEGALSNFMNQLHAHLKIDFANLMLAPYFVKLRKLAEIETECKIRVKGMEGLRFETSPHERVGVAEVADEAGGGFATVLLLQDTPEPWERRNQQNDKRNGD